MAKDAEFDLWHYTTEEGLKGILSSKTLWATDYRYLNDSSEFIYSKSVIHEEVLSKVRDTIENICRKQILGIKNATKIVTTEAINILYDRFLNNPSLSFPQQPLVLSFCKHEKNDYSQKYGLLSQWRGYGKDGGYAIIFDLQEMINEFEIEKSSFYYGGDANDEVVYGVDELKNTNRTKEYLDIISDSACRICVALLNKEVFLPPTKEETEALFGCMAFLKHEGFREEKEYRFCVMPHHKEVQRERTFEEDKHKSFKEIKTRNNRGTLVPYIELFKSSGNLPIKGICIGPHHDKELRAKSIKAYLDSAGLVNIEVFCSGIPYIGSR